MILHRSSNPDTAPTVLLGPLAEAARGWIKANGFNRALHGAPRSKYSHLAWHAGTTHHVVRRLVGGKEITLGSALRIARVVGLRLAWHAGASATEHDDA